MSRTSIADTPLMLVAHRTMRMPVSRRCRTKWMRASSTSRRFRAAQQFLQMLGIGPSGSTVSRPVVPSSLRTAGGRVLCVG